MLDGIKNFKKTGGLKKVEDMPKQAPKAAAPKSGNDVPWRK